MVVERDDHQWNQSCKKYYNELRRKAIFYIQYKEERLSGLATSCIGTAF